MIISYSYNDRIINVAATIKGASFWFLKASFIGMFSILAFITPLQIFNSIVCLYTVFVIYTRSIVTIVWNEMKSQNSMGEKSINLIFFPKFNLKVSSIKGLLYNMLFSKVLTTIFSCKTSLKAFKSTVIAYLIVLKSGDIKPYFGGIHIVGNIRKTNKEHLCRRNEELYGNLLSYALFQDV